MAWRRAVGFITVLLLATWAALRPTFAQSVDAIAERVVQDFAAGNDAAALVDARRLEAAIKAHVGTKNQFYAKALGFEAAALTRLGRYGEAEAFYRRGRVIGEEGLLEGGRAILEV